MKLTRKKALEICIELWTWLAETGGLKEDWEGWERWGEMLNDCPFCELYFDKQCQHCPLANGSYRGCFDTEFKNWVNAISKNSAQRKRWARIFLERLLEIR